MKIGILTQPLKLNYGGILQAYALQEVLRRMGFDVKTIHLMLFSDDKVTVRKLLSYLKRNIQKKVFGENVPTKFNIGVSRTEYSIRSVNVWPFINKRISLTKTINSLSELSGLESENFDAIVVGSDQVWVPGNLPAFLLDFTEGWNIKRVSYAASFGHSEWRMDNVKTCICSKYAKKFDAISVREDSGVALCKDFLGVEAKHVLDPTLLLDADDYLSIVEAEDKIEKTVFSYVLNSNEQKKKIVVKIADALGAKVTSTLNIDKGIDDKTNIQPSIDQWINGIKNADFVVTDSFHGTAFCLVFRKQFAVMGNPNRGLTRIYSLLKLFGLEDRFANQESQIEGLLQNRIDYKIIKSKIEAYKKSSMEFLHNSLR